jgi:hypothetical protein
LAAFADAFIEMEIEGQDLGELKDSELKELFVSGLMLECSYAYSDDVDRG